VGDHGRGHRIKATAEEDAAGVVADDHALDAAAEDECGDGMGALVNRDRAAQGHGWAVRRNWIRKLTAGSVISACAYDGLVPMDYICYLVQPMAKRPTLAGRLIAQRRD
jgi:hypothetical protein